MQHKMFPKRMKLWQFLPAENLQCYSGSQCIWGLILYYCINALAFVLHMNSLFSGYFFFNIPQLCAMQYNAAGGSARNTLPPQLCYNVELLRAGEVILQRWSCFLMKPYPRENNCRFQGDPRRTAGCFKKFLALAFVQNSHEILEMQLLLSA